MTKKTDTPAIRFKGFSDAWEQRKLNDIATMYERIGCAHWARIFCADSVALA